MLKKALYTHRSSVVVLLHSLPHSTPCFTVPEAFSPAMDSCALFAGTGLIHNRNVKENMPL